jgi:MoxR-like ATPase
MASGPASPSRDSHASPLEGDVPAALHGPFDSVESVRDACASFRHVADALRTAIGRTVIGQQDAVEQVLMALLANGHVLLEGVPGLGKTLLVKALGAALGLNFARIQCTPDLMPADVLGTHIVVDDEAGGGRSMRFRPGPIFAQILLVDEINRATPKSQSALLEAMQERRVTVGGETRDLPSPFLVLATQNPIEQEGTYPLPEAQLDRFLLKVTVPYVSREELVAILERTTGGATPVHPPVLGTAGIAAAQRLARMVLVAPHVQDYAIRLVLATHPGGPDCPTDLASLITIGASPRAAQALLSCAKVRALFAGRASVGTSDIAAIAHAALRHRVMRSFEAEAGGIAVDAIIDRALAHVPREWQP